MAARKDSRRAAPSTQASDPDPEVEPPHPSTSTPRRTIRIEVSLKSVVLLGASIFAVWLLRQLFDVVLVVVVALMLVGTMAPIIEWLERKGLARGRAIVVAYAGLILGMGAFGIVTVPSLLSQLGSILRRLPEIEQKTGDVLSQWAVTEPLANSIRSGGSRALADRAAPFVLSYSKTAFETLAYAATTLFLSLYLIIDRDRMKGALFVLVPRKHHVALARILLNLETIVGGYMRGQLITSVMMAAFTFVILTIARVPNAIALATFAGLTDVLPYIGAILACGPATMASYSRGVPTMLFVFAALVVYQECESRFIVPRIYGQVLRLPSSIVMIALLVGGTLMGVVGALLALPLAAGIRMVVEELRLQLPGQALPDVRTAAQDRSANRSYARRARGEPVIEAAAIATEIAVERLEQDEEAGKNSPDVAITSG